MLFAIQGFCHFAIATPAAIAEPLQAGATARRCSRPSIFYLSPSRRRDAMMPRRLREGELSIDDAFSKTPAAMSAILFHIRESALPDALVAAPIACRRWLIAAPPRPRLVGVKLM